MADRVCTSSSLLSTYTQNNLQMLDSKIKISNSKFKISVSSLATAVRLIHAAQTMQRKEKSKLSLKMLKDSNLSEGSI